MASNHGRQWLVFLGTVVAGCASARPEAGPVVRPGIDVLLDDSVHLVRGRRVGLVTNHTGVDRRGVSDVERLQGAGVTLVAIFSPEHGFRGAAAPGAAIASATDSATGLPIYSLYGATLAPTPAMLEGIEVLLIDLQDVGARYYTYISTTIEVMRSAASSAIPVIVLDRPNPIGGTVQGNVLDTTFRSFVGKLAVPMRHGMTLGELARLARQDLDLAVELRVVPVAAWRRGMFFDSTGLPLLPPSPNLRTLESMQHYPGLCLFEGTNLSVGRGTDAPFAQVGAPWLDAERVLVEIGAEPGVAFQPVQLRPSRPGDGKYADTLIHGIRLRVTDRTRYDPTVTALRMLGAIRKTHPDQLRFLPAHFDRLAGERGLRAALERGAPTDSLALAWRPAREDFLARRTSLLLYPE